MIDDNMDFIDADKPEYAGGPTDHLEQRHLGKQPIAFVQTHHRPMTNAELRENRDCAIEIIEKNDSIEYWIGTTKTRNNVTHALNAIVEMAEQVDNNCCVIWRL